ncbi:MAG: helix-turn-helix domain-containing protein [Candidatus Freyarchaeota archaeon]
MITYKFRLYPTKEQRRKTTGDFRNM